MNKSLAPLAVLAVALAFFVGCASAGYHEKAWEYRVDSFWPNRDEGAYCFAALSAQRMPCSISTPIAGNVSAFNAQTAPNRTTISL